MQHVNVKRRFSAPVEKVFEAYSNHADWKNWAGFSNSWLEVRPVVDKHGLLQLPDAIRDHGPWNGYDAYLSGPPGMIRSGVDALKAAGVPADRIRHDSVEELVAAGD